jgi:DNA polymerase-1
MLEVLKRLIDRGVEVWTDGNRLHYHAPQGVIDTDLKTALNEHKPRLIKILQGSTATGAARPVARPAPPQAAVLPTCSPAGATSPGPENVTSWGAAYHLVDTPAKFNAFLEALKQQRRFAIDLETTSLDTTRARIVGYAVCWRAGEGWYLPVMGPEGQPRLDYDQALSRLRRMLEDPAVAKVNQNLKYDALVLRRHGVRLAGFAGDPMLGDYLLRAGQRGHDEDSLALRYLNYRMIPIGDLIGKKGVKGRPQLTMDQVPTERAATYAAEDADVALRLCDALEARLQAEGMTSLYSDVEVPLIEVLVEMESHGVRIDVPRLQSLSREMGEEIRQLEGEIYRLAERRFNLESPKQLREILFIEQRLPVQNKTAGGDPSTDAETLQQLAALGHTLPQKLAEHRRLTKLKGTYVDTLPRLVSPATGRVHTSFNQAVTATGRLSSSQPNLQNIPTRGERGKEIRRAFVPAAGWLLLKADYSQIELRILAHYCGDQELRQAYHDDRDIHTLVAAQVFGVGEGQVTSDQRRFAKTVNFGVIYGMSAYGLARRLGIAKEEAGAFIDSYFARYPKVASYQNDLLAECRRTGYVSTLLGRRRYVSGIRPWTRYRDRNRPEREAVNMQIQGSAADLIKLAMLNVYRRLRREGRQARMLLQVHDELVFELPPDELHAVAACVQEEMEGAMRLEVPLKAELAFGPNWLDVTPWELPQAG